MNAEWIQWSWPAAFSFAAVGCVAGSLFAEGPAAAVLVGAGITVAIAGIARHLVGTWRIGNSH